MNRKLCLLVLVVALLTGCRGGEVLAPVTGLVTLEGQPVPNAWVLFDNDQLGVHMSAPADKDGRFVARMANGDGFPLGEYDVRVCPPVQDHPLGPITAPPPGVDPYLASIPLKYRKRETSGLKLTVKKQNNTFDIEMKRE